MKCVVLYARRNTGLCILSYLVALGYKVKVMSDDENILWMANVLNLEIVTLDTMREFDLFLCVHGNKIIPREYLRYNLFLNCHPCLYKYRGANPIKRYILNEDEEGSVEVQWMVEEVDAGEVIHREDFKTGKVKSFAEFYNVAMPFYFKAIDAALKKIL